MTILEKITTVFFWWIDAVARALSAPLHGFKSVRRIEVVEEDDEAFALRLARKANAREAELGPCRVRIVAGMLDPPLSEPWAAAIRGSRVEMLLRSSRFLFRPLELPSRASEFLDGIIRAQIDRLTPWSAGEAAYHWTAPQPVAGERISVTIAATARAGLIALAQAFSDIGAAAVDVATATPAADRVVVYNASATGQGEFGRIRTLLIGTIAVAALMLMISAGASGFLVDHYDGQKQQIQRRIAERRAMIAGGSTGTGGTALELLERRKQTTPASVIAVEALAALLPDHTYATEVRIEGDKLQVIGITRDAPSLIPLLEQSPHFSRAAFFAPTTRASNDTGERFHIELKIKTYFGPNS
jgi:general secretion pathway protein L